MIKRFSMAIAALGLLTGTALADQIVGNWKTESGETANIYSCGGSFCIRLKTGKDAGKMIGRFKPNGGSSYTGKITDPRDNKEYTGKASIRGTRLTMKGCVLFGVICKGETWKRM